MRDFFYFSYHKHWTKKSNFLTGFKLYKREVSTLLFLLLFYVLPSYFRKFSRKDALRAVRVSSCTNRVYASIIKN